VTDSVIDSRWYQRPPGMRERIAAGGVVVRPTAARPLVALTRPRGVSDFLLPKGGVDKEEDLEQAARREIAEEAGIVRLKCLQSLGTRSRLSFNKSRWTTTHYFLFQTDQVGPGPTQGDRYAPAWFPIDALPAMLWPEKIIQLLKNK
jgi:8-oxo-dGTP pyrophosphatase MutT (NUDIX family)